MIVWMEYDINSSVTVAIGFKISLEISLNNETQFYPSAH